MRLAAGAGLGPYEIEAPIGAGDVTPDEQRFVFDSGSLRDRLPLTVVLNWQAEVASRAGR